MSSFVIPFFYGSDSKTITGTVIYSGSSSAKAKSYGSASFWEVGSGTGSASK
jgi:hypothetical protein